MEKRKSTDCFLVFSDDFGEHPTSCQHIFGYIPDGYPVLWVNTIGMRSPKPTVRDFQKIILKSKKMIYGFFSNTGKGSHPEKINVLQPPMLPFQKISIFRKINSFIVCHLVKKRLQGLKMKSPVLVITAPNASDYIGEFGERRVVYYCVDDFVEWPGLEKDLVRNMEKELIQKADICFATSDNLYNKLVKVGKKTHLLTHGVDYKFFEILPEEEHDLLKGIPKPRVGYFGLFDERSDQKIILEIAERMPGVYFVITGGIEVDISKFRKQHNIKFTGSIPYNELPAMVKGFDICMLPYKVNKLTNAIQPLKFKEYLATGKPVVSTPIQEACKLGRYVMIAESLYGWEHYILKGLNGISADEQAKRKLFLEGESWNKKAKSFVDICLRDEKR